MLCSLLVPESAPAAKAELLGTSHIAWGPWHDSDLFIYVILTTHAVCGCRHTEQLSFGHSPRKRCSVTGLHHKQETDRKQNAHCVVLTVSDVSSVDALPELRNPPTTV